MNAWKHFESKYQTLSFFCDTGRWGIQLTFRRGEGFYLVMAEFLCAGLQWYCQSMPLLRKAEVPPLPV